LFSKLSIAKLFKVSSAIYLAFLQPAIIIYGCILAAINFSASFNNSPASTATVVVPSPTSSSYAFAISTKILAAGLSTCIDFKIVAPSLVTVISYFGPAPVGFKILSIPFGPSVVFTKSLTA